MASPPWGCSERNKENEERITGYGAGLATDNRFILPAIYGEFEGNVPNTAVCDFLVRRYP